MLGKTIRPQSSEIREKQDLKRRFDNKGKGQYCTVSAQKRENFPNGSRQLNNSENIANQVFKQLFRTKKQDHSFSLGKIIYQLKVFVL